MSGVCRTLVRAHPDDVSFASSGDFSSGQRVLCSTYDDAVDFATGHTRFLGRRVGDHGFDSVWKHVGIYFAVVVGQRHAVRSIAAHAETTLGAGRPGRNLIVHVPLHFCVVERVGKNAHCTQGTDVRFRRVLVSVEDVGGDDRHVVDPRHGTRGTSTWSDVCPRLGWPGAHS